MDITGLKVGEHPRIARGAWRVFHASATAQCRLGIVKVDVNFVAYIYFCFFRFHSLQSGFAQG